MFEVQERKPETGFRKLGTPSLAGPRARRGPGFDWPVYRWSEILGMLKYSSVCREQSGAGDKSSVFDSQTLPNAQLLILSHMSRATAMLFGSKTPRSCLACHWMVKEKGFCMPAALLKRCVHVQSGLKRTAGW